MPACHVILSIHKLCYLFIASFISFFELIGENNWELGTNFIFKLLSTLSSSKLKVAFTKYPYRDRQKSLQNNYLFMTNKKHAGR